MYCVIIQDDLLNIEQVIQCDTMKEVQDTLEKVQPFMDSEYLIIGEASTVTFGNKTYSFRKLDHANSLSTV